MNVRRNFILVGLAVVLTLLGLHVPGSTALAQDAEQPKYQQPPLIDVSFEGGTVQQYINAIRKQGTNVNVILDVEDLNLPMPAVELRSVELESAIFVLRKRQVVADGILAELDVNMIRHSPRDNPTFVISAETRSVDRSGPNRSAVLSVKDVINAGLTPSDILTAVETALELFGDDRARAEMRFHEETGLLIARGSSEQMATIHEVMDQLRESVDQEMQSRAEAEEIERIHVDAMRMRDELDTCRREMDIAAREVTQSRTRSEMLERELEHARIALQEQANRTAEYNTQTQQLRSEIQRLHDQLEQAKRKP